MPSERHTDGDETGKQSASGADQGLDSLILSYAKQEKANARGRYHELESGSFEQGTKLGRLHAMSDVIEIIHKNRSVESETGHNE